MSKDMNAKKSSKTLPIAIASVGIILIIAGGGYALYERYVVGSHRLLTLAFNPLVDVLGIIGLVLLFVGVALFYRKVTPSTTGSPNSTTTGDSQPKPM